MRFVYTAGVVASLASAAVVGPRQAAPTEIYKLPGSAWIETIAVRSNGDVLLNRLDTNEVWSVTPSTKAGAEVVSFPGFTSTTGVCEYQPDVFAVVTGNFTTSSLTNKPGSWGIWSVDFNASPVKTTLITKVPTSGFWIGCSALNNDIVFVADAAQGQIYSVSMSTAAVAVAAQDAAMKAPASGYQEGIHGIKYSNGDIYFTNTFGSAFGKIAVDAATSKLAGAVTALGSGWANPEDFAIGADGSAYVAQVGSNTVVRLPMAGGAASRVASVSSPSSCAFGRGTNDTGTLYVSTTTGAVYALNLA